ncbi:MAG: hypothetical protein AB8C13_03795 [Phycisphaerales bacterium]
MHTQHHPALGIFAAAITLAAVTEGVQGQTSRVIPAQAAEETPVVEWVEISIHMPDGRVIVTKEKRFPSRSQIFARTGRLPIISIASSQSAGPESGNLTETAGASQTAVLAEGSVDGGVESGEEPMSFVEAAPAQSSTDGQSGSVASAGSGLTGIIQDDEAAVASPAAAPASTGAVRSFRKSSS